LKESSEVVQNADLHASDSEGPGIYCSVCAAPNSVIDRHCVGCWSSLATVLTSQEEASALRRRLLARRLVRQLAHWSALGLVLTFLIVYAQGNLVSSVVPSPSGFTNSAAGLGTWSLSGRDVAHSAWVTNEPLLKGDLAWRFEGGQRLTAGPVVAGGSVYQTTWNERIVALDVLTGALLWEFPVLGPVDGSPALTDTSVYAGFRSGRFVSLERETGHLLWSVELGHSIFASPTVSAGVVYVATHSGEVFGLDAHTGRALWSLDVGGGVNAAPVISGKFLVVTSIEGVVHILDLTTGEKRLDYSIRQNVLSTPAFLGNVLIVATDEGNLLALDATKVEYLFERMLRRFRSQWFLWGLQDTPPTPKGFLWSRPLERDSKATSPAIADGRAYIVSTGGILHSVDVVTGDLYWAYDAGSPTKRRVAPVVAGDFVYMATIFGEVHVVDRIRGDLVKMFTIEAEPSAQLVVADGTLYIPGEDGSLTSIR